MRNENRCSAASAIVIAILAILILTYFSKSVKVDQPITSQQLQEELFYSGMVPYLAKIFN